MISLRKSKMMALVGTMLVGTMLFAGRGGSQQSTGDKAKEASIEGKVSASGSTALTAVKTSTGGISKQKC